MNGPWDFSGKVAIVTGGSRGIGRAVAAALAAAGAKTVFTYQSADAAAEALCAEAREKGQTLIAAKVDVRDAAGMAALVDKTEAEVGPIDIVVNNAGIIRDGLLAAMPPEDWSDVLDTNVTGTVNLLKPATRAMMRRRRGVVVNLSSVVAQKPGKGQANYAASKGAVESLTKALAAELGGRGVRVNCVAPGMIATDMSKAVRDAAGEQILAQIPLKRFGEPEDIAAAVLFLASDHARYITGQILQVTGGL
jgi:3-oxoacyl-[acyl-carrier protein] reductase